MLFWNKKVTQEELESHRSYVSQRHHFAVGEINLRVESLEVKLDLILSHLKLKYVPETETKEPAKLVEKTNINLGVDFGHFKPFPSLMDEYCGYSIYGKDLPVFTKPKKKGRPKKK